MSFIRSVTAPVAACVVVCVVVLGLLLWRLQLLPADARVFASLGVAQSVADGGPFGDALLIPQPGDPVLNPLPLYPLALVPVLLMAADPVGAGPVWGAAWLDAALYAGVAGLLVLYAEAELGVVCALALGVSAGFSPVFGNPGAFRAPGGALLLVLVLAVLLVARRLPRVGGSLPRAGGSLPRAGGAGVGTVLALGVLMGLAALTHLTGALLVPAVLLSDSIVRRRLTWPPVLAALVAAAVFGAVTLATGTGAAAAALDGVGLDVGLTGYAHAMLSRLVLLPGRLSVFWGGDGGPGWAQAAMLSLAALGLVSRVRGGMTAAEPLFAVQVGMLLGDADDGGGGVGLGWLVPSVLVLVYAVIGGCAVGGRVWRGAGPTLGGCVAVVLSAGLAVAAWLAPMSAPNVMDAAAQAGLHRIRLTIPPNAVLVGPDPLALAFFTGRAAGALRMAPSAPGFWHWVAAIRATHLAEPVDAAVTAGAVPGVDLIVDTGRYRLYRLLGPPVDPVRR